jgi:dipeptidyl aminopeptidase/acylaminoacyl peptidase
MISRCAKFIFGTFVLFGISSLVFAGKKNEKKAMPPMPNQKIVFVRADPTLGIASTRSITDAESTGDISGSHEAGEYQSTAAANPKSSRIGIMNPDGSGATMLKVYGVDPDLSPDGTKVVYCSERETLWAQIYVVNVDGTSAKRLTDIKGGDACGPRWSHDGKKIAFHAFARMNPRHDPAIWIMDADGSNQKKVMDSGLEPTWSPDGKQIAFASDRNGGIFQIYAMNADGSNVRRLTNHKGEDSSPSWAPDGAAIVYSTQASGDRLGLFLMSVDGKEQHGVAHSKYQDFCFPTWSMDGRMVLFTALNRFGPQNIMVGEERPRCELWSGEYQIFAMDSDGQTYTVTDARVMAMHASYGKAK